MNGFRRITCLQEKGTLIDEGEDRVSGCVGGGFVRWNEKVRDFTDTRGTSSMNLDSYSFIHPAKHLGLLNDVLDSFKGDWLHPRNSKKLPL